MRYTDKMVLEDKVVNSHHLRKHLSDFNIDDIRITDVTNRYKLREGTINLIEKITSNG